MSLTDAYIRLEAALTRQNAPSVARMVIAAEVVAWVVFLLIVWEEGLAALHITLPIGALVCLGGILVYRRSRGWGRTLVWLGSYPLIAFLAWVSPWLGALAAVISIIIILVAFAA